MPYDKFGTKKSTEKQIENTVNTAYAILHETMINMRNVSVIDKDYLRLCAEKVMTYAPLHRPARAVSLYKEMYPILDKRQRILIAECNNCGVYIGAIHNESELEGFTCEYCGGTGYKLTSEIAHNA